MEARSSYPWSRLMTGWRVLISMDSRILRHHMLSSRAITLTLSILMGCSWSLTAVRGDFCFRWSFILAQGIEGLVVSPDCMVFENSGQFFGCTSDIWKAHAGAGLDPYVITCTYETCKISPLFQCICVDINRPLRLMAQMGQIVGNKE